MINFVPAYYKKFKCVADKCKHSCCTGWEIDVDADSIKKYKEIATPFGKKILDNIDFSDEKNPHFALTQNERCPFLDKSNLCEIINNLGEGALCQICADHPRFRNFYDNFTETGIGLCCEAAAKLILTETDAFEVLPEVTSDVKTTNSEISEYEALFLAKRKRAFEAMADRNLPIEKRLEKLLKECGVKYKKHKFDDSAEFLLTLEILDEAWENLIKNSIGKMPSDNLDSVYKTFSLPLEQLCNYLIFRHTATEDAVYFQNENSFCENLAFCVGITEFFAWLISIKAENDSNFSLESLCEIARMMSSEIEYSEDNTESLKNWFFAG